MLLSQNKLQQRIKIALTSVGANKQFPPSVVATSFPFEVGKSQRITFAPSRTNLSTVARPRPDDPPVTKPTIFCSK